MTETGNNGSQAFAYYTAEHSQMLHPSNDQEPMESSNSPSATKNKYKASKLPAAIRNKKFGPAPPDVCGAFAAAIPMPPPPILIILEEGKDVPVFWNGDNPVPLIKWSPTLDKEANYEYNFATVHDFLSTYAAGKYLRKCAMSLQCSSTKYINDLKMDDPFLKILDHQRKQGKPVTLLLTHTSGNEDESGYSKFTLYIRENNGRKVLWNGSIPTNRMVAKLNQSDMGLTIETCLLNYVARGYLSQNCQVDLVKECSDTIPRTSREESSRVSLQDPVSTLFKGNSACIVIRSKPNTSSNNNDSEDTQACSGCEVLSQFSSSTNIVVFTVPPVECHWVGAKWGDIKEEVRGLVNSVELTMRDMILPTEVYANVVDKKRALETAIRRRTRVVDEVWRKFQALKNLHNELTSGNPVPRSASNFLMNRGGGSQLVVLGRGLLGGDVDTAIQAQQSCIDFLSSSLIRYGLELDLYDEETQGLSRIAGVGVGIAVVVAICTVVYYF